MNNFPLILRAYHLFGNSPAITHSCCNSIFHIALIHHTRGKRAQGAVDRTRENLNTREFQDLPPPFLSLTAFCGNKLRPRSSPLLRVASKGLVRHWSNPPILLSSPLSFSPPPSPSQLPFLPCHWSAFVRMESVGRRGGGGVGIRVSHI